MWAHIICLALLPAAFGKSARSLKPLEQLRDGDGFGGLFVPPSGGSDARQEDHNPSDLNLFGGKKMADAANNEYLAKSLKEAEAAVAAGTLKLSERRSKRSDHQYKMCVFCDNMCLGQIASAGYATPDDYFDQMVDYMNSFVDELDPSAQFVLEYKLLPDTDFYLQWFGSGETGVTELTNINNNFWQESGLYATATSNGCDVDFLLASRSDPSWSPMGGVEGIANLFGMCQSAYSTVKLNNSPQVTSAIMIHEFAHMLGVYHDGPASTDFTNMEPQFKGGMLSACESEYDELVAECTDDTPDNCFMDTSVSGATSFSSCSVAYVNIFFCMADIMPTWYSVACAED